MPLHISEERYLSLSESEKQVIDYINDHVNLLPEMSITTVASKTFTSPATVSRAIRKCGYEGIYELRYSLSEKKHQSDDESFLVNSILSKSYRECGKTIENISIPSILKIVDYIKDSKKIYAYARGYTALVAEEFVMELQYLGYNGFCVKDSVMMQKTQYIISPEDTIFIISVRNTTPELLESAIAAKKVGAKVVTLCCTEGTNLEKYSDVSIIGYAENVIENDYTLVASKIPLMIICRAIVEYLAR